MKTLLLLPHTDMSNDESIAHSLAELDRLNDNMARNIDTLDAILARMRAEQAVFGSDSGDDEYSVEPEEYERMMEEEGVQEPLSPILLPSPGPLVRHTNFEVTSPAGPIVRFDDFVYYMDEDDSTVTEDVRIEQPRFSLDSNATVPYYQSLWHRAQVNDDGECSDTETVVDEWIEPYASPSGGDLVADEILSDTDEETVAPMDPEF